MWNVLPVIAGVFNIAAAYQLLRVGTFIKTRGYKITNISVAIFCLIKLCKLQHWPTMQLPLLFWASTFVIAIFYLIHALKKPKKQWPDALKVVWIFSYSTAILFSQMNWPYADVLSLISLVSIAIVYFHYIFFYEEIKATREYELTEKHS